MDLAKNLELAKSAMETAQVVKPDVTELDAIKRFCSAEVKFREDSATSTAELKDLRLQQKNLKLDILKDFKGTNKCLALSKADALRLDTDSATAGIDNVPRFLRLLQSNKDATITTEIIQEALESITTEDVREASLANPEDTRLAIRNLVLTNVRRLIRSYTETMKISESVQRGMNIYDVPELSIDSSTKMWTIWSLDKTIKRTLESKKQEKDVTEKHNELKEKIEGYFIRTGLTAQRIVVSGKPYKLTRRVSVRKPKIGIGKIEKLLDDVLENETLFKTFDNFRPQDLIRCLQIQLTSVPPETKSTIVLSSIKET